MGIEEGLLLWFKNFWKKSLKIVVSPIMRLNKIYDQLKNYTNQLLKIKKKKVYSGFKDNIWGADLADMQLISKFNKVFRFLSCVIDIFSKYSWVVP